VQPPGAADGKGMAAAVTLAYMATLPMAALTSLLTPAFSQHPTEKSDLYFISMRVQLEL
jgi:hypothetical protein